MTMPFQNRYFPEKMIQLTTMRETKSEVSIKESKRLSGKLGVVEWEWSMGSEYQLFFLGHPITF